MDGTVREAGLGWRARLSLKITFSKSKITFSISIAVKIRKMGHMVNSVFDGEFSPL
jgi:hypothetical protein